jgi:hypothetical protein
MVKSFARFQFRNDKRHFFWASVLLVHLWMSTLSANLTWTTILTSGGQGRHGNKKFDYAVIIPGRQDT